MVSPSVTVTLNKILFNGWPDEVLIRSIKNLLTSFRLNNLIKDYV